MTDANTSRIPLLDKVFPNNDLKLVPGTLVCGESRTVATPAEALGALRAFGGEGWLCATGGREIFRFSPEAPCPADEVVGWPLEGEVVRGEESLHLGRMDQGWACTVLRRTAADHGALLMETAFLARDGKGLLRYVTAWGPMEADGMEELRPQRFRFVGFGARGVGADAEEA